eukprot:365312-Chlamydomonas_euryale.AAC.4
MSAAVATALPLGHRGARRLPPLVSNVPLPRPCAAPTSMPSPPAHRLAPLRRRPCPQIAQTHPRQPFRARGWRCPRRRAQLQQRRRADAAAGQAACMAISSDARRPRRRCVCVPVGGRRPGTVVGRLGGGWHVCGARRRAGRALRLHTRCMHSVR